MTPPLPIRVASILLWGIGVGFGSPCPWAIRNLLAGRGLPIIFGIRAYGGGSFERLDVHTFVNLLGLFMIVCALEVVAGSSLWGGHKTGAVLALGLVPVGAVFWWGFALPIPPVFAIVRTVLIAVNWRSLT